MANTYSWIIEGLGCSPELDGKTDVVVVIHWKRQVSDDQGHSSCIFGVQEVTLNPDSPFTPYEDLTEAKVIEWLEASFGEENLAIQKATLDAQLEEVVNPPIVKLALPWSKENGAEG